MATIDDIPKTYDQATRSLAGQHAELDPEHMQIFLFPDPQHQVVKLIEISEVFPDLGRVAAFPLGRSVNFPFKTVVAQITPAQWKRILAGELSLPADWNMDTKDQVYP